MPQRKSMSDFDISNSITEVHYKRLSHRELGSFLRCNDKSLPRQKRAQALLDYLCDKYDLPQMKVRIVDSPQPKKNGRTYEAFYYFRSHLVKVFNLTSTEKPVSIRMMAVTVLHEFMHHYDRYYLGIDNTPHTKGFFSRIRDLKSKMT